MHCSLVDEASSFCCSFWFMTRRSIHGISLKNLMRLGNDSDKEVDLRSLPPFPSDFFVDDLPETNLYPLVHGSNLFLFCGERIKLPFLSSKIYQLSLVDNFLRVSEAPPHYVPPLPATFRAPLFFARIGAELYVLQYQYSKRSLCHEPKEEGFWVLDCTRQQWRALECPPPMGTKNLFPESSFVLRDKIFSTAMEAPENKPHLYVFDTRTEKWDETDYKLTNSLLVVGTVVSLPALETVVVSWDWSIHDAGRFRRRVTFCADLLDCQDNSVLCSQSLDDELRTPVLRRKPDPEVKIVDLGGEGLLCAVVRGMTDQYDDIGNCTVLCVFVFALSLSTQEFSDTNAAFSPSRKEKEQRRFLNVDVRVNRVFKSPELYEEEGFLLLDTLHDAFVIPSMQEESPYKNDVDSRDLVTKYELKIGCGKSVTLPSQALPAPPPRHMAIRCKEGHAVIPGPSSLPATSMPNQNFEQVLSPIIPDIMVIYPEYDHLRQGDTLQRWRTEPSIMTKGVGRWVRPQTPIATSPEHEQESGSTHAGGRSRREEPERTLTGAQRDEFENMLRALTSERSQIKEAMRFSLDNADAAGEIVDVLTHSLTLKETPIDNKIAKLMLVSAILHNSGTPWRNASAYRTKFEATVPDIMESFNVLYHSLMGSIAAEALKEGVLRILQVWADCFVFSDAYVNGLRATFLRSGNSGVIPFHSICGDAPEIEQKISSEDTVVGGKTNKDLPLAMSRGAATKELMSLPLAELERRCRHNGLSLVGGREMMVARLLSLEEAEKQRGYELDDELKLAQNQANAGKYSSSRRETSAEPGPVGLSGWNHYGDEDLPPQGIGSAPLTSTTLPIPQPELKAFAKKEKNVLVLPVSKWAQVDDESDDEQQRSRKNLGLSYSSSGSEKVRDGLTEADTSISAHAESQMNEEQRQKLRRLEVALIIKEEIEKKVAAYRKRLQSEYGLSDSGEDGQGNRRTSLERRDRHEVSRKRHHSRSPSQ